MRALESTSTPRFSAPVSWLPRPIREPRRPLVALIVAWLTAFLPSILLGAAAAGFFPNLGQPNLAIGNPLAVTLVVIVAPLLETLIMAAALAVLLLVLPPTGAVLVSAIGWGIAHSLAAPAWGLVIWWPFLIFSTLFVVWRQRSLLAAIAMPAATHALHNAIPALLLFSGMRA